MLGTALASGLQTYSAVSNERRRRQLHDLQVEGATLRNEGARLSNQYDRDSMDDRLRQTRRNADNADAIASINEWKRKYEEETYDLRFDEQAAKTLTAQNTATLRGYQASVAGYDYDHARRTHAGRVEATTATQQATIAKSRGETHKANQEFFSQRLTPVLASSPTPDHLFHNPEAVGAFMAEAENVYGDQLREQYGEDARLDGFMYENDMVRLLIDEDGDGEADFSAPDVPLDQFLMEALGEDKGRVEYRRLKDGEALAIQIQQEGARQIQTLENNLRDSQREYQHLSENAETLEYMNGRLAELEAEKARLEQTGGFDADSVGEYGTTSPLQARMDSTGRLEEIEQEIESLRIGAEQLGVTSYLGRPENFQADLEAQRGNVQTLGTQLQGAPGEVRRRLSDALGQRRMGESADDIRARTGLQAPRSVAELDQKHFDLIEKVPEIISAEALNADNVRFDGNDRQRPQYTQRDVLDTQRSAQSWLNTQEGVQWSRGLLGQGVDGERRVRETLRTIAMHAADANVPFQSAADALTGDYQDVAADALEFRRDLGSSTRTRNVFKGMGDAERARLMDAMQREYGHLRMENPELSHDEAERRVLGLFQ